MLECAYSDELKQMKVIWRLFQAPHNPEAAGSSPAPAIEGICFLTGVFFVLKEIWIFDSAGLEAERTPTE